MPFIVPLAVFFTALTIPYALTVNRRATVARTILCVIFPIESALFAWSFWNEWREASGADASQYWIVFVCACVACVVTSAGLGRRMWWLRHNRHSG